MCCRSQGVVRTRASSHQKEFQAVVRDFGQEALRMANLKHPNIVGVHQVFEDNNTAYMALDFVQGQELLEVIEKDRDRLNPAEIKRILLQLLDAIAYIHERDVVHRDIAPDNILLDTSGNPVLIDFGAAREVATRASRALSALQIVKDGYSPQEFYVTNGMQTASSDIYSLAATFYHLITGAPPPNSQVRLAALAADERDPYIPIPPRTEGYDHFFLGAIDKGLAVFPKHRSAIRRGMDRGNRSGKASIGDGRKGQEGRSDHAFHQAAYGRDQQGPAGRRKKKTARAPSSHSCKSG